jgi:phosphoadenosine phosphosulfate reductase
MLSKTSPDKTSPDGPAPCWNKTAGALERILESVRGPVALAFSYQAEDAAALHLLLQCNSGSKGGISDLEVFTLDTHKLFPEIAAYHQALEAFFGIPIRAYQPDPTEEKDLEAKLGEWGMRDSLENRHLCCDVRKVHSLQKILATKNAWVTGLRASQSVTRSDVKMLEYDEQFNLIKINPLYNWSEEDLGAYTQKYKLPVNPLYAKGFKSIGCAPCTRPVKDGEDIRAGRWWWENPEHKECGLHRKNT